MKILIDLQSCQASGSRNRGIGRYSMSLAKAMVKFAPEHDFWLLLNSIFPESITSITDTFKDLVPLEKIVVFTPPVGAEELASESNWRTQAGELIRDAVIQKIKPDVVHVTSLFEGLTDACVVSVSKSNPDMITAVTLYDLIPLLYPTRYLSNERVKSYYMRKIDALTRADVLLGISAYSSEEALAVLPGLSAEKMVNISTAIDEDFGQLAQDSQVVPVQHKQFGIARRFIMYTGGIDWRKNIEGLIKAYSLMPPSTRMSYQLVLVCHIDPTVQKSLNVFCRSVDLAPDEVVFTGFVSDEELKRLYRTCSLFVFPSLHEGFGLPVLEAMKCGAPVIGSNTSSIPEVIGNEEALFDPSSEKEIAQLMQRVLTDVSFRESLKQHSVIQATKFSWEVSARRALAAIVDARLRKKKETFPAYLNADSTLRRKRPTLAMLTPMQPAKSGIADYSAELLPLLSEHYDITVIVCQDTTTLTIGNQIIKSVEWFRSRAKSFDRIVYQLGNSKFHAHMFHLLRQFPGVVVLHDFYLSGVLNWMESTKYDSGVFYRALMRSHGHEGMQFEGKEGRWKTVQSYPCNRFVIERSKGIIVHSTNAVQLANSIYGATFAQDWKVIPMLRKVPKVDRRSEARIALGVSPNDLLICSFGHLAAEKMNDRLLVAWMKSTLYGDPKCRLVFVGENDSGDYCRDIDKKIAQIQAPEQISITGFVPPGLYEEYLAAADFAVQLRAGSRGETSKSVLDCLAYRLPVIINAKGSMAEFPDTVVYKLQGEFSDMDLVQALEILKVSPNERKRLSESGFQLLVEQHDPQSIAKNYKEAIEEFYTSATGLSCMDYWNLIDSIAKLPKPDKSEDVVAVAAAVAKNLKNI